MPHTPKFEHDDFNDLELFETLDDMGLDYDPDGYAGEQDMLLDMICMQLDDETGVEEFDAFMSDDNFYDDYRMYPDDDDVPF